MEALGLYISFPFCRAKCSYCNFASGVFAPARMQQYVDRLCEEAAQAAGYAAPLQAELPMRVDTLYFGGGTPSLISAPDTDRIFVALREHFTLAPEAEITMECAPGQLSDELLETWQRLGVNRVSLGVQSFVDREAAAVGRLHTRRLCLADIARLRAAGIHNLNVDLIAGLPRQSMHSWRESLAVLADTGVPHASVYMFEVDEDSRLGLEILQGGKKYRAADVPGDELVAEMYLHACDALAAQGTAQYEISNFARQGHASRHNMRYWLRRPYLGVGLDAHSMLAAGGNDAVRFANTDDLDRYCAADSRLPYERISTAQALEESLFLGLRMNAGISLASLQARFGDAVAVYRGGVEELAAEGLLTFSGDTAALTAQGRLLSNEVFGRLLEATPA